MSSTLGSPPLSSPWPGWVPGRKESKKGLGLMLIQLKGQEDRRLE